MHCKEHLQERGLSHIYSDANFNHYYRKFKCAGGNAWTTALKAADWIIYYTQAGRKAA